MRALILACGAASLALACGSGSSPKDDTSGRTAPTQTNLTIATTGNGLVRGAGTDCRGSCRAQIAVGAPVHLVAVPDSGAFFVGWAGACSGSGACDLILDVDRDVSATFGDTPPPPPPGKHLLVLVVQGKGRVTSSPAGIDCDSGTCSSPFDSGASVTLTAVPAAGFTFSGWGTDCSGPGACTLSLSKDATVFANFVAAPPPPPAQVHLTASVSGPGTVTGGGLTCGQSATICDVMVAAGTTVTLTANPASATRFTGWGGACSGTANSCPLTLQSDTSVTAEFQPEVVVLAPNDGTNGGVIAINSTHMFWPRHMGNFTTEIWSVSKNGGEAVALARFVAVDAMVADDAFLYWTDRNFISSMPVAGGPVATIASGASIGKLVLDELGALYWTTGPLQPSGSGPGQVHRMQDRVETILADVPAPTGGVAVDATHVYFTHFQGEGTLQRVSRTGGKVEILFPCGSDCFPRVVRADSRFVYFRATVFNSSASGHVRAWSKADGSLRLLSGGNGDGRDDGRSSSDWDVDVNGSVAFWNWTRGNVSGPFGIFRANADGSGFAAIDTDEGLPWRALRVDDVAVYYEHDGAIIRRLK